MSAPSSPSSLDASICASCARHIIPARARCPYCGGAMQPVHVEGRGKILSWTAVHVTPEGIPSPRTVALVGLECGAAVLCLVDNGQIPVMDQGGEVVFEAGLYRFRWAI